jgi:glycosyltransferase involved in cell wall biosynthesis
VTPSLIVLPADPEAMSIGGIASFIRGFVKYAPADIPVRMIGMSAARPVGSWQPVEMEGRTIDFLPIARMPRAARGSGAPRRATVPLALRFTSALTARHRRANTSTSVTQFHRPGTALPLLRHAGPMWRVVHLTREDLADAASESRWRRLGRPLDAVEGIAFRRMQRIFVVNRAATERYRRRFPGAADRIEFLPNWFDDDLFTLLGDARRLELRERLADELRLPASARILLYAGRLEGQKRPGMVIEAFAAATGDMDAVLLLAGDGSLREEAEEEARRLGCADRVRFLGTRPRGELAELMNAADGLLIGSAFETGPTVGLEALACGLPVITTPVGEVSALVRDGSSGWVARDHSPEALAEGIRWLMGTERDSLRTECRRLAEPLAARRVLGRVYDLHRELAAVSPAHPAQPPSGAKR